MNIRKYISLFVIVGVVTSLAFVSAVSAQGFGPRGFGRGMMYGRGMGVIGSVTAVNGNSITITSKGGLNTTSGSSYTVDATNATIMKNGASATASNIAVGDMIMAQGTLSNTTITATNIRDGMMGPGMRKDMGIAGTVASVSGNTITVTSKGGWNSTAGTTYTVDATNATVSKDGVSSSVSSIATGDMVMVQGTVNGASVTATAIHDGKGPKEGMPFGQNVASIIQGNGQPVVGGTITAINGTALTVTNTGNVTYTVDATNATVTKDGASSSVSSIAVNDRVVVQGTVNGTSISAASIVDQGGAPSTQTSTPGSMPPAHHGFMGGFLGSIGNFFGHLFKFF